MEAPSSATNSVRRDPFTSPRATPRTGEREQIFVRDIGELANRIRCVGREPIGEHARRANNRQNDGYPLRIFRSSSTRVIPFI